MATLTLLMGPKAGETGDDVSVPLAGLDDDQALRIAHQLRKLLKAWRAPVFTVRDSGGGEIARIDLRRLREVHVDAKVAGPAQPQACGKSAAANDP